MAYQFPTALVRLDGGSTLIAWYDLRTGSASADPYVQAVSDDGQLLWQSNGVRVCELAGDQVITSAVPDGSGGAILFWNDNRSGNQSDIYAQRLDAGGTPLWGLNGVPVCTAVGNKQSARAIPDGVGGALVCWQDGRNLAHYDVFAQRLNANGVELWAHDGIAVCTASSEQSPPRIISDGVGGAILTWYDYRSGAADIYAARVSETGLTLWTDDGVPVCTASGSQYSPIAVQDGLGGATICWTDGRSGPPNVYAQRINGDGLALWVANGIAVAPQSADQQGTTMVEDDAGGSVLAWQDFRAGQNDIYAQRLDGAGLAQWLVGGVVISNASGAQMVASAVRDGAGGAIVIWTDQRSDAGDVYAQRVDHSGGIAWTMNGVPLSTAPLAQSVSVVAADGNGGVVAAWGDDRTGNLTDVYAQRLNADGLPAFPDSDIPRITGVRDAPNDQGGHVFVTWRASALDARDSRVVTGYRVWRRVPAPGEGAPVVAVDGAPAREIVSLPSRRSAVSGIELSYWEAVVTLPAERLQGYGYVAPTTQDSIAGSNPYTAFFVTALTGDPFVFYQSDVDSGYSVDNLSPPMPVPFAATYAATANALHWTTSRAPDLREFRLYRGGATDFVPGPSNLILASRDTGYVDLPGASYYKLAAVDIHGNVSRYALVSPSSPVATLASLVSVDAQNDRVRLVWYVADNAGLAATVYRRTVDGEWASVGGISADGSGYLRYEDAAVASGNRYGYRLGIMDEGQEVFAGEVWVEVLALRLALRGAKPNPAVGGRLQVEFTLRGTEAARLELIDVAGRVVRAVEVGSLGPGTHGFELAGDSPLRPGIYFLRLRQSGEDVRTRIAVID